MMTCQSTDRPELPPTGGTYKLSPVKVLNKTPRKNDILVAWGTRTTALQLPIPPNEETESTGEWDGTKKRKM